jgi:tetrahydromethanopterin S-methyltransferase subunit A
MTEKSNNSFAWESAFAAIDNSSKSNCLSVDMFRKKLPKFEGRISNENIRFLALPVASVASFGGREIYAIMGDNIDINSHDFGIAEGVVILQELIDGKDEYKTVDIFKRNGNISNWMPLFEKGHIFENLTPERLKQMADDAYTNLILGQEIKL